MSRLKKLIAVLRTARYRRALFSTGVAASVENVDFLRDRSFKSVIDVGANRGQFALAVLQECPGVKLYCFEPVPAALGRLRGTVGTHPDVTIFPMALGAEAGYADINVPTNDSGSSLALDIEDANKVRIDIQTLDAVMAALPALAGPVLLKMDVQGYELQVLQGGESTLSQVDDVYAEVTFRCLDKRQAPAHEIVAWLRDRGFDLAGAYNIVGIGQPYLACDFHFQRRRD